MLVINEPSYKNPCRTISSTEGKINGINLWPTPPHVREVWTTPYGGLVHGLEIRYKHHSFKKCKPLFELDNFSIFGFTTLLLETTYVQLQVCRMYSLNHPGRLKCGINQTSQLKFGKKSVFQVLHSE